MCRVVQDGNYSGILEASNTQMAQWCNSEGFHALLSSTFPVNTGSLDSVPQDVALEDVHIKNACTEAMDFVQQFESTHCLSVQNMSLTYLQQRSALVSKLLRIGAQSGLPDEAVHDGVLLMDRAMSCASEVNGVM